MSLTIKLDVISELNTSIFDQVEDDKIDKEIEETSDLKGDIQERIVIRSDSSSSEREDEGGSLYTATSVSSSNKSSAKKKNAKHRTNRETAEIRDQEIWRKPPRVSIALG